MPVNLVLIGPPGSGKGTQAVRIAERYRIPHISTGDILRAAVKADSPLGRQVSATLVSGALVSDTLMADLVRERLAEADVASGFVLDGFPRTVAQAQALDDILASGSLVIVQIDVAEEAIVQRLASRRICDACHITQSVSVSAESAPSPCPYCGGSLVRREDDEPPIVRRRLAAYAKYAEPVIAHYRPRPGFVAVNGLQFPDDVTRSLVAAIDRALVK
jgi:adenylate kinase